jgi:hypothetical protein
MSRESVSGHSIGRARSISDIRSKSALVCPVATREAKLHSKCLPATIRPTASMVAPGRRRGRRGAPAASAAPPGRRGRRECGGEATVFFEDWARTKAALPPSVVGADLMTQAFKPGGPLALGTLHPGEAGGGTSWLVGSLRPSEMRLAIEFSATGATPSADVAPATT